MNTYENQIHRSGRFWMVAAFLLLLAVPISMSLYFGAWPKASEVLKGLLSVAPVFWTVTTIEVFTYAPMLGAGGTYLAFVTGNITMLKAPAAINAMEAIDAKAGSEEAEVISTIAIAVTAIVTTIVLLLGVILFSQISVILEARILKPAFKNILPALFGGLGVIYISKNYKLAIAPLAFIICLFIAVPSLVTAVSVLVPVAALISIGTARILYKKGKL